MVLKLELHQNHPETWVSGSAGLGWAVLCITEHSRMMLDSDKFQVTLLVPGAPFQAGNRTSPREGWEEGSEGKGQPRHTLAGPGV